MRILKLLLFLMIAVVVVDFIIINDMIVTVGFWPFNFEFDLSVGLVGLLGFLLGIIVLIVRNLLLAGYELVSPRKNTLSDKKAPPG